MFTQTLEKWGRGYNNKLGIRETALEMKLNIKIHFLLLCVILASVKG